MIRLIPAPRDVARLLGNVDQIMSDSDDEDDATAPPIYYPWNQYGSVAITDFIYDEVYIEYIICVKVVVCLFLVFVGQPHDFK